MKRRAFIQRLAATGMILPMTMGFPRVRAFAKSPAGSPFMRLAAGSSDRIIVMIRLAGGNDGLNTIVPYSNPEYYTARAEGEVFIRAEEVLKLPDSSTMGLHPALAPLYTLYQEKKVAIVQNVGYPNQNLSHFRSTDIWLSGTDANVFENSGWYAKYLEQINPDYPDILPTDPFAIELGTYLSNTLVGAKNNMGIAVSDLNYIPGQPADDPVANTNAGQEEEYVRQIMKQTNIFSNAILAAAAKQTTNKVTYPANNTIASALSGIAKIIAGGLKTQMYIVNLSGYDTHSNQITQQANLHKTFADAVFAFQRDMEAFGLDKKVCVMTISEFGRRVTSNGTGTDHGSAAPLIVIGSSVQPGLIGNTPNLNDLEGAGNLKMQYDFRQVYASVLGQWFGAPDTDIVPHALPRQFEQLPIFLRQASSVFENDNATAGMMLGQNYPNPAITTTTIPVDGILSGAEARFVLSTVDGREILTERILPGQSSIKIDVSTFPAGNYLYSIQAGRQSQVRSMIIAH
jgi:uncharacterized protein (DUF1501 family)